MKTLTFTRYSFPLLSFFLMLISLQRAYTQTLSAPEDVLVPQLYKVDGGLAKPLPVANLKLSTTSTKIASGDTLRTLLTRNGIFPDTQSFAAFYTLNPTLSGDKPLPVDAQVVVPLVEGDTTLKQARDDGYLVSIKSDDLLTRYLYSQISQDLKSRISLFKNDGTIQYSDTNQKEALINQLALAEFSLNKASRIGLDVSTSQIGSVYFRANTLSEELNRITRNGNMNGDIFSTITKHTSAYTLAAETIGEHQDAEIKIVIFDKLANESDKNPGKFICYIAANDYDKINHKPIDPEQLIIVSAVKAPVIIKHWEFGAFYIWVSATDVKKDAIPISNSYFRKSGDDSEIHLALK